VHVCAQVLRVKSCTAGSHARSVLRDGDILLTVAGRPVTHFAAVEAAVAAASSASAGAALAAAQQLQNGSAGDLSGLAQASSGEGNEASAATTFQVGGDVAAGADVAAAGGDARCAKRRRGVSGAAIDMLPLASDASTLDAILNRQRTFPRWRSAPVCLSLMHVACMSSQKAFVGDLLSCARSLHGMSLTERLYHVGVFMQVRAAAG
jgi:hypothetical protein